MSVLARDSHVGDATVSVGVEDKILGFDVSVDDFISVHVLEADEDVGHKELGLFLSEGSFVSQVIAQVTAVQVVYYEVEMLSVLKSCCHVDQKGVVQVAKELFLVHD